MSLNTGTNRLGKIGAAIVGAVGLCAVAVPLAPAQAQAVVPYLGIDFGNGWGVGVGAPPSAYGMRAESPLAPFFSPWPTYYRY